MDMDTQEVGSVRSGHSASRDHKSPFIYTGAVAELRAQSSPCKYGENAKKSALIIENIGWNDDTDDEHEYFARTQNFVLIDNMERLGQQAPAASARIRRDRSAEVYCAETIIPAMKRRRQTLSEATETEISAKRRRLVAPAKTCQQTSSAGDARVYVSESSNDSDGSDGAYDAKHDDKADEHSRDGSRSDCAFSDITYEEGQQNFVFQPLIGPLISIAHVLEEQHQRVAAYMEANAEQPLRMNGDGMFMFSFPEVRREFASVPN